MQDHAAKPADAGATEAKPQLDAREQRELTERLAQHATPKDVATYLSSHPAHQKEALAYLAQHKGNSFVQQVTAAIKEGPLGGAMLVSNNPEGLSSPGVILQTKAKAGALAAYVHHSNHTKKAMDISLVVKPTNGPVTATLSGASAATGGSKRADGGKGAWASDPNVVVAAANEAAGDAKDKDSHNRTDITKHVDGPTTIKLGTLPAGGAGDPPLFDARYDLVLSGDAEIDVVAGGVTDAWAEGNTKYELAGTNGRAAGMYEGASFASDDTALVSKLPFKKPLTGTKFGGAPSPKVEQAQAVTASDATLEDALEQKGDARAVFVLERVFRIAPSWLTEKGVWDGTTLTTKGLTDDYAQLITSLKAAKDVAAIKAVIAKHPTVGAGLDAASYGTMFEVGVLIDNDTKTKAGVVLDFLTDAAANAAGKPGAVFRGVVSVDGVDHAINNDTASGHASHATLGSAEIEAGKSKYVHVHFQSPGQISAGQELDIKKK